MAGFPALALIQRLVAIIANFLRHQFGLTATFGAWLDCHSHLVTSI
jgi:hypothetical protein